MESLMPLLGYVGILFMLIGYFTIVMGHMKVTDNSFIMLNVIGSLLLVIALYSGVVLPILYVVGVWLLISLFGLVKHHTTTTV